MDPTAIIFSTVIVLVLVITGYTLVIAITGRHEVGHRFREKLAKRLEGLPFYAMLRGRNIDIDAYLRHASASEISAQLDECEACPQVAACESMLSTPDPAQADFSFCPHAPIIEQLRMDNEAR